MNECELVIVNNPISNSGWDKWVVSLWDVWVMKMKIFSIETLEMFSSVPIDKFENSHEDYNVRSDGSIEAK